MAKFIRVFGVAPAVAFCAAMCAWTGVTAAASELLLAQVSPPGMAAQPGVVLPTGPRGTTPSAPAAMPQSAAPEAVSPGRSIIPAPSAAPQSPAGPVRLINLPKLDNKAMRELIAGLLTRFELGGGYGAASEAQARLLPVPAKVTAFGNVLARTDPDKKTLLLRLGYVRQPGQLPQLWSHGLTLAPDPSGPNPDAAQLDEAIGAILDSRQKNDTGIPVSQLANGVIRLGYVDADSAMSLLKSMGHNAVSAAGAAAGGDPRGSQGYPGQQGQSGSPGYSGSQGYPGQQGSGESQGIPGAKAPIEAATLPATVSNDQLPIIIKMPGPSGQDVGLVGGGSEAANSSSYGSYGSSGTGSFGLSTVMGATSRLAQETISSPTSQLMVMFHPDRPEQFARIRKSVADFIDRPARQIVVEGMVLEVSTDGLEELGVQWDLQEGMNTFLLGALRPGASLNTVDAARNSRQVLNREFLLKVQALVRQGKAEVLARPSVLTLDNRQATIRVGTDIPIATSKSATATSGTPDLSVSFSFNYLPTGIQLNVRPRIDNEGREVSMLIDATVSSTVPGQDLAVRGGAGQVLASAPTIASRRVQTYARIPDNTPLIIGGLISKNNETAADKVPGLGDLPLFGPLFRATHVKASKREVIIVLTPYILPEGRANFAQAIPDDNLPFEDVTNVLFRDVYRLRAGDVFDTGYIRTNQRLLTYRELAQRIVENNPARGEKPPFSQVLDNRVPGERNLITGMIYETLQKRGIGGQIHADHMLVFNQGGGAEFGVRRVDSLLAERGDGSDYRSFFSLHPDKCLAITYLFQRRAVVEGDVLEEPRPQVSMLDCKRDRSDWKQVLYDLNLDTADGRDRHTILIKDDTDIARIGRALLIKHLMTVNGGESRATIGNYLIGRQIAIPTLQPTQTHLIEAEVARLFYLTELYYPAFEVEFERTMAEIDKALRSGQFDDIIRPEEIPTVLRTESALRRN